MEILTQEEIVFIKNMYAQNQILLVAQSKQKQIDEALSVVAEKYKDSLDEATQKGDISLRKQIIEQQTAEAKEVEAQILGIN